MPFRTPTERASSFTSLVRLTEAKLVKLKLGYGRFLTWWKVAALPVKVVKRQDSEECDQHPQHFGTL